MDREEENGQDENGQDELAPRDYQNELLQKAIECNSIICLKTGAGKTYIAIMLIKEYQHELRKDYDEDGKRTFFLVPKVPLVTQQGDAIERNTSLKVGQYYGAMGVDFWKKENWKKELMDNHVLVMTPQILVNMLQHGFMTLDKINLLIFDECHAATGQSPYCTLMSRFADFHERPRILGLTASVLNGKCSPCRVKKKMEDLEKALYSRIQTTSNQREVNQYATKPKEVIVAYGSECDNPTLQAVADKLENKIAQLVYRQYQIIENILQSKSKKSKDGADNGFKSLDQILKWLQNLGESDDSNGCQELETSPSEMLKSVLDTLRILGLWCAKWLVTKYLDEVPNRILDAQESDKTELALALGKCQACFKRVIEVYMEECFILTLKQEIQLVRPAVRRLTELLKEFGPAAGRRESSDAEFRGIIFVERRIIAWILADYLQILSEVESEQFGYVKPCYVVGHGLSFSTSNRSSMGVKKQESMLSTFKCGMTNLLLATQVVEEGLDIPKCNIVIRFDPPKSYCSYIQSMGRARAENALYILLTPASELASLKQDLVVFKILEEELNKASHNRSVPTLDACEQFYNAYHPIRPYYPGDRQGAVLTLATAASILNRYCNSLPHDRYTQLLPSCKFYKNEEDTSKIRCIMLLPSSSCFLKPFVGQYMDDQKTAKKAAAFEACVHLHQTGELNDNLMPSTNYLERYGGRLGIIPMPPEGNSLPIPGTKKSRKVYEKQCADCFLDSFPKLSQQAYLYAIVIYSKDQEKEGQGFANGFGILTSNVIPETCCFRLSGKTTYEVKLRLLYENVQLRRSQLEAFERFHKFLFDVVLGLVGSSMQYLPEKAATSFLIVPLKGDMLKTSLSIDMELVLHSSQIAYDPNVQCGDILLPQHGDSHMKDRRFYVLEVCRDLTPESSLENDCITYKDYFFKKYGMDTTDVNQNLVRVDYVSNEFNFLNNASPQRNRKGLYLIPEFCHKFPLNIDSYDQARRLPCVLHRLNGLLLARQLRDQLIAEVHVGSYDLNFNSDMILEDVCEVYKVTDDIIFSPESPTTDHDPTQLGALLYQALTTRSANNWSDLERLEVIGDSFLKYIVSVFLICDLKYLNEGKLTALRTGMIRNFTLFSHAVTKNIPGIVNASMFQPKVMWLPPGFVICEELLKPLLEIEAHLWPFAKLADLQDYVNHNEWISALQNRWKSASPAIRVPAFANNIVDSTSSNGDNENGDNGSGSQHMFNHYTHVVIGDKTIADCAEAIIGTILICCGQKAAINFLDWLGLKLKPEMYPWTPSSGESVGELGKQFTLIDDLCELESQLGYKFNNPVFLEQAVTHPSYTNLHYGSENYQQLEFLGDAVLDFLVTMNLYKDHPKLSPGDMTDLRSSMVDNITFGYLAVKNGFHKYLKHASPTMFKSIDQCILQMKSLKHPKDILYLMTEDDTLTLEDIEVPKVLGDLFESIAGAVFLDSGLSLEEVWKVYQPMLRDVMEIYCVCLPVSPVRVLMERYPAAKFKKCEKVKEMNAMEVTCAGKTFTGVGRSKIVAKQAAAKCALRNLNIPATRLLAN